MPRIQVMSDIHTEFHRDRGLGFIRSLDPTGVDVLVLAGDISNAHNIEATLQTFLEQYAGIPIAYVRGNHEHYGKSPQWVLPRLRRLETASKGQLYFLDGETETIAGIRIYGAPLWFPEHPLNVTYMRSWSDFIHIQDFVPWVYEQNRTQTAQLQRLFPDTGSVGADVVVTHYLPTYAAVSPKYRGEDTNRFFVSPVADRLPQLPKWWVFGHTHDCKWFEAGGCTFVANPLGYPQEGGKGFQDRLVLEIEPTVR